MKLKLRFGLRATWFAAELTLFFLVYFCRWLGAGGRLASAERSRWLQWCCRRSLRVFAVQTTVVGTPPATGLLICNHLSYVDVLVLSALTPAVFISKAEVRHWPVFGWCARLGGTLFVDRTRRGDVRRVNARLESVLASGSVVVLFPEGTSWNGREVLPFKSSLLEPIVALQRPLWIGHLRYVLSDGDASAEVCFWGETSFLSHLLNLMTKRHIQAEVRFAPITNPATDRKILARQLHEAVVALGSGG